MKKTYTTPRVEIISLQTLSMLAASINPDKSFEVNNGDGPSGGITWDNGTDESDSRHMGGFGKRLWEE